ncbi:MAG: hypothetical protein IT383_23835 [Deltaproteobacteria bacterium]|nr:hypothetical protein [Deltaproteobacteria bacterium]
MLTFPLALALAAVTAPETGGLAVRVALLEVDGPASANDRAALTQLLDDALTQRGLSPVREPAPRDCGAPCLEGIARRSGTELALRAELATAAAGWSLTLGLFDPRRPEAGVTQGAVSGADLNALGAKLGAAVDGLLAPALALRGAGPGTIRRGLGWGTPGLILGGGLAVAGVTLVGAGSWPFIDRALGAAEVERLRVASASPAELDAASRRVSLAQQALSEWGLSALGIGAGAALVGAAMMSGAAGE